MNIERKILQNGMHIVLIPTNCTNIVSIGLFIKIGSFNESDNPGIVHFIEHLFFRKLLESSENAAIVFQAETNVDYTVFYAEILPNDLEDAMKILFDTFYNFNISIDEFEKEKPIVIDEIKLLQESFEDIVNEKIEKILLDIKPSYELNENIRNFSYETVNNFIKKYYYSTTSTFAIAGNLNRQKINYNLVNKITPLNKVILNNKKINCINLPVVRIERIMTSQAYISISFISDSLYSDYLEVYDVLSNILLSNSRLYNLLRVKNELAYSFDAFNQSYANYGFFMIMCQTDNNNISQVIGLILSALSEMKDHGISFTELDQAIKVSIINFSAQLQTTTNKLFYYGINELQYNSPGNLDMNSKINKYKNISVDKMNNVVNKLFVGNKMCIYIGLA